MSFAGDLHTFDLFDLLGWLMGRKKAGILQMTRRSTKKRLAFRDGAVQWTSSNDPRETIGQALVRESLVTEEALFKALLKQETDKRRLGELLIADGHLTEPQLMKTLRAQRRGAPARPVPLGGRALRVRRRAAARARALGPGCRAEAGARGGPSPAGDLEPAPPALPFERDHLPPAGRPGVGHEPGASADPRHRRLGKDARRDQPGVPSIRVRDDAPDRRTLRRRRPRRGPGRGGGPGGRPGGDHPDPPRGGGDAAQGGALRRRARGLREGAHPRRAEPGREEGPPRGGGGAAEGEDGEEDPAREGAGPAPDRDGPLAAALRPPGGLRALPHQRRSGTSARC